ncbi:dihydroxyacetone kinase subunit DhaL [Kibdelosporangium phytohabitans]|uniref:Dihydroxyacetone kinase n=1 Tax=Kibdelosporangium phytohabitans TaxID=860235 RepID=A0A0N9IKH9_9PSEU|nr:dihydroxyacetone kinase subunit DhaL [Kibdelosporangium phytohabitans]ALG15574.1 dihydroxyacetone kinase [Kibdelosporangium phytohabitans]MBE1465049.1 dihydroxyacetone kinase-like protein [Kibdelosporangium phytohabitans]
MGCDAAGVIAAIRSAAAVVDAHRDELVNLDREIGDADHGENLKRGFTAVVSKLDAAGDTPGAVLKVVASTLISTVGGAAGPLYGTAFLRAAAKLGTAVAVTPGSVVDALEAALEGVVARGKAEPGDKTMVDALTPAVAAARAAPGSVADVLRAAADAADQGARDTVPLVARKGRASYLGERSAGHMDPGARSTALLLRAFAEAAS